MVCVFSFFAVNFLIKEMVTHGFAIFICYLRGQVLCAAQFTLLLVPSFLWQQCASDSVQSTQCSIHPVHKALLCVPAVQSEHCILLTPVIGSEMGMWHNWCILDVVASVGWRGKRHFSSRTAYNKSKVNLASQELLPGAWYWSLHRGGLSQERKSRCDWAPEPSYSRNQSFPWAFQFCSPVNPIFCLTQF